MEKTSLFATIIKKALDMNATDIHISPGTKPAFRIDGIISFPEGLPLLSSDDLKEILNTILDEGELGRFEEGKDVDTTKKYRDLGRFRHHLFRDENGINIALRVLARALPEIGTLGLPESVRDLITKPHGLILIAGPTGAGKTTTRSVLIDYINRRESKHIVSLEDTIEYAHENKKSVIRLRTIGEGKHSPSYAHALSSAMREDPDIISVGDLRDVESMRVALQAAQTGHLVIAEIHATNVTSAIERILTSFSAADREFIKEQLAQVLVGIVAQRLVPGKDGGNVLAVEILKNKNSIQNRIRENRIDMIPDLMRMSGEDGMITLEDYLNTLAVEGQITLETFKRYSA